MANGISDIDFVYYDDSEPTTATAVGVRLESDGLKVYAPFGLNDMFGMIVKANKAKITKEI